MNCLDLFRERVLIDSPITLCLVKQFSVMYTCMFVL